MITEEEIYTELRRIEAHMKSNKVELREDQERWEALLWVLDFPLVPVPVDKLMRALLVGQIRNACADLPSARTEPTDAAQQTKFWEANKDTMKMYLFLNPKDFQPVGYCGALQRDGKMWTTAAVLPEHRGHDYGRKIMRFFLRMVEYDCWATARRDNPAAVKLHTSEDWEVWMSEDKLFHFHTWRGRK
jgi:GNAT superfamily N-acetyltransferase